MEGLKLIPYLALVICISGVILGASSITLAQFGDTLTNKCWDTTRTYNSTSQACNCVTSLCTDNNSLGQGRNFSNEYWVIWNAADAEGTVGEQLGTVAIIGIMVVVISLIAGVFVYMRYFG